MKAIGEATDHEKQKKAWLPVYDYTIFFDSILYVCVAF